MARFIIAEIVASILTHTLIEMGAWKVAAMFLLIAIVIFIIVIFPELKNKKNNK